MQVKSVDAGRMPSGRSRCFTSVVGGKSKVWATQRRESASHGDKVTPQQRKREMEAKKTRSGGPWRANFQGDEISFVGNAPHPFLSFPLFQFDCCPFQLHCPFWLLLHPSRHPAHCPEISPVWYFTYTTSSEWVVKMRNTRLISLPSSDSLILV